MKTIEQVCKEQNDTICTLRTEVERLRGIIDEYASLKRLKEAEERLAKIRGWLVDFWLSENDVTSDVAGDFLRKEAHAAAAKEKP